MLNYDKLSRLFSCLLLTRNHMIFLMQFGINKRLLIFSKTTNCTRPTGSYNSVSLQKKFTRAYLFQIGLEIVWLPLQMTHTKTMQRSPRGSLFSGSRQVIIKSLKQYVTSFLKFTFEGRIRSYSQTEVPWGSERLQKRVRARSYRWD